jgi:putative Mg2+ transporter-C (MgtC) family protein
MWLDLLGMTGTLLLAALMGSMVGWERERRDRPAGLRTHILVCVGAALITLVSERLDGANADPTRIAAQIVSGIGFLGAGTIIRQGSMIRGLTTAASLWTVAGIGMAIAVGREMALLAVIAAGIVFFTLSVVDWLEQKYVTGRHYLRLRLVTGPDRDIVARVLLELAERSIQARGVAIEEAAEGGELAVSMTLRPPSQFHRQALTEWLTRQPGILRHQWE